MELYKVFYYAALHKNLTEASKQLFISQPAVSQSIKQLEQNLDVKLFYRQQRGVQLTSEGQTLFEYTEKAINLLNAGENHLSEIKEMKLGEVNIGAADTICRHYLLPFLEDFRQAYPGISLHITNRTTRETIKLLKRGRVDFGLINTPFKDESLVVRPIKQIQDCFAASKSYSFLQNKTMALSDLNNYPLLMLESLALSRQIMDSFFLHHGIILKPEIELGSIDLLTSFAISGMGIVCTTKEFIDEELKEGKLFILKIEKPIPPRAIGLTYRKGLPLSSAAHHFIEDFLLKNRADSPYTS